MIYRGLSGVFCRLIICSPYLSLSLRKDVANPPLESRFHPYNFLHFSSIFVLNNSGAVNTLKNGRTEKPQE